MANSQMLKMKDVMENTFEIDNILCSILYRIGMPVKLRGYNYVKSAILHALDDPERIHSITKRIYPHVAKEFNTTASRVERAIRHAIECTWQIGSVKEAVDKYEYSFRNIRCKPTNSEFIAEAVEIITSELKKKICA